MSNRKSTKQQLTEIVFAQIPSQYNEDLETPIDSLLFKWWMSGRQDGLRLTPKGMLAFKLADIEYYDYPFQIEEKTWYQFLVELNKKMKCPYYIGVNKIEKSNKPYIRLYDSKIAMMVGLYGNFTEYLDSIKEKK